jgi:hypothetical protein
MFNKPSLFESLVVCAVANAVCLAVVVVPRRSTSTMGSEVRSRV